MGVSKIIISIISLLVFLLPVLMLCGEIKNKPMEEKIYQEERIEVSRKQTRGQRIKNIIWEEVKIFTFDTPESIKGAKILEGTWGVKKGKLWTTDGKCNRAILLYPSGMDPVRIEFDAILYPNKDGQICDITILLNTAEGNLSKYWRGGYCLTTGSYWNTCTLFFKLGKVIARAEYSPLCAKKTHHVVLEFDKGHISYWIDNRIIMEIWDDIPLKMDNKHWIGIRNWETLMSVDNFTIYKEKESM